MAQPRSGCWYCSAWAPVTPCRGTPGWTPERRSRSTGRQWPPRCGRWTPCTSTAGSCRHRSLSLLVQRVTALGRKEEARLDRHATRHSLEQIGATMYSTRGHQQVVNEYHDECLRKAQERETETRRVHGHDAATPREPQGTS